MIGHPNQPWTPRSTRFQAAHSRPNRAGRTFPRPTPSYASPRQAVPQATPPPIGSCRAGAVDQGTPAAFANTLLPSPPSPFVAACVKTPTAHSTVPRNAVACSLAAMSPMLLRWGRCLSTFFLLRRMDYCFLPRRDTCK